MRNIFIYLVLLLVVSVNGVFAHGPGGEGHGPQTELTQNEVSERAIELVAKIVASGKLDASWAEIQPSGVTKKNFNGSQEWVVTFNNPGEKDAAKQKLYVFINIYGQYLGANHTGS